MSPSTAWATLNHANASGQLGAGSCVNVAPGTYSDGVDMRVGGNAATSTGYVVYRCQTLSGCTITDPGNQGCPTWPNDCDTHAAFAMRANYTIMDGFVLDALGAKGTFDNGVGSGSFGAFGYHHIWILNSIIRNGYGQAGIQIGTDDFVYIVHNTVELTANATDCGGINGSGISVAGAAPVESVVPGYVLTADDKNNSVTGNTGTLFRHFVTWNVVHNNYIDPSCGLHSDGNGIIMDTMGWDCGPGNTGCQTGRQPYLKGGLVAFNVVYNNSGSGIELTASPYITVANNTCYNNWLDPTVITSAWNAPCIATGMGSSSWGATVVNNIAYMICPNALGTPSLSAILPSSPTPVETTTLGGPITAAAASIPLGSANTMPGGSGGYAFNGSYALPGGNLIRVDNEVMLVTAGWATTTLTVQRGYLGTTAAAHNSGATVNWTPNYFANNITKLAGNSSCTGEEVPVFDNNFYSSSFNKMTTNPLWVNVGGINGGSAGNDSTPPSATNFALQSTSPAIGYGQTPAWLSVQASDAGACYHTLASCP
jgi:parallel beta-helix repeat protein